MTWEIQNTSGEIINWDKLHAPTHKKGRVDEIDLTGLDIDYVHITSEVAQALKAEYTITTDDLAAYVHGVKVELTRGADIQPSNGCWFGGQFVLNAGSSGWTALDKPAYVLQAIFKGSDTSPNGVDIHVGRFETQSAGRVSDIVHILANTGTTITGSLEYIATHVAPSVSMVNINAQSSVTVPTGIKIMSGAGSSYNYGLDLASATINTADIRFQGGTTLIDDGTDLTLAGANLVLGAGLTLGGDVTGGGYDLDNIGHIGLGNYTANEYFGLRFIEVETLMADNTPRGGASLYIDTYKTSAAYTSYLSGCAFEVYATRLNTQNWTNAVGLRGVYGAVGIETGSAAPSTITGAASFYADADISGATNDMVVTNYYGLYVSANTLVGNSKLTNDYGIYIENQAGGATLNYAIYTNAGLVRFGDNVEMASGKTVDGIDISAHDVATVGVHGAGGNTILYSDHTDDLDAHTRDALEILRTGEYYHSGLSLPVNRAVSANYLYGMPLIVARDITVDRIAIQVTIAGAAGKKMRLGIYNNGTNLYPGTLVLDAGTVDIDSTGVKTITINQALTKGIYFLAFVSDGTPTLRGMNGSYLAQLLLGINATDFTKQNNGWAAVFSYATLPASFTAGGAFGDTNRPGVLVRVASLD